MIVITILKVIIIIIGFVNIVEHFILNQLDLENSIKGDGEKEKAV